jgi:predicted nuclease of predicted toxin-antitoxin system
MPRYLVDANLPYYFSVWREEAYEHVIDIDPGMKDSQIWEYAKKHELTIITKDADFSDRMLLNDPPPRVIHIRLGNMKIKTFYNLIQPIWEEVLLLSQRHKLVNVYADRIEGIG